MNDDFDALLTAAEAGDLVATQALLATGANVHINEKDSICSRTALYFAAVKGHVHIVRALLAAGALADKKDENGWTPLHAATEKGHLDVVLTSLSGGAEGDKRGLYGRTALQSASLEGHENVVRALLAAGACVDKQVIYGWNSLHAASGTGYANIVSILLENDANVNDKNHDIDSMNALQYASAKNIISVVHALLDAGANVYTKNNSLTALHFAAIIGNVEIIQTLLLRGAELNPKDRSQRNVMEMALMNGHLKAYAILKEAVEVHR